MNSKIDSIDKLKLLKYGQKVFLVICLIYDSPTEKHTDQYSIHEWRIGHTIILINEENEKIAWVNCHADDENIAISLRDFQVISNDYNDNGIFLTLEDVRKHVEKRKKQIDERPKDLFTFDLNNLDEKFKPTIEDWDYIS